MGRRSPLPRWLSAAGIAPPRGACGKRHLLLLPSLPVAGRDVARRPGAILQELGTIDSVTLPADNGTWSVVLVTSACDRAMSGLRDNAHWERTVKSLPRIAHWVDGQPIDAKVVTITKVEDRIRRYLVDGAPVVTGVVSVGDAWACTGPHHGRGASIGMTHGLILRKQLRDIGLSDPYRFVDFFHHATAEEVEPWFIWTRAQTQHRLAEIAAGIRGEEYRPSNPRWELEQALSCAATRDADCLRVFVRSALLIEPLEPTRLSDRVADRIRDLGANWRQEPVPAPSRDKLVALANQ